MKKSFIYALLTSALAIPAWADDQNKVTQAAPAPTTLSTPSMFGPLAANPNPYNIDAGPLGKIYATGVVSGLGLVQTNHVTNDQNSLLDVSNAQIMIQKTDGLVQFYLQGGAYDQPALGATYLRTREVTSDLYGYVPIAYVKIAPTDNFSIQVGKLYTLIGTENTFTFQNANIQRGLLWNQTNAVNRGVQVNYAQGSFSGSLAISDGFYSGEMNWVSGAATYTIDPNNSITLLASGNFNHDSENTLATPLALNNSQLTQLNYSYTTGPWVFSPTLQWTHVPKDTNVGLAASAYTYGAGLTTKYNINNNWNIAARAEYINSTGNTNVAYGPGSDAFSFTVTPHWQQGIFFVRPEASFVKALNTTSGSAFGKNGTDNTQARLMLETGVLF